jgi:DNA-binding transcriptional ArsR family regulator
MNVMPDPAQSSASPPPPRLPLAKVLPAIASERRWNILRELAKGEPLPVIKVAHRLRATPAGTSKHFAVLLASGIILRTYGGNYKIDPRFLVPGGRAIDIGHVLLRFD